MFLCTPTSIALSDAADVAQVVIAVFNLLLALYILLYQRRKDKEQLARETLLEQEQRVQNQRVERATALLHEQNIKLQWFKELIVEPNRAVINNFYDRISGIKEKITSNDLSTAEKEAINDLVKNELAEFRKSFIDVLVQVDRKFAEHVMKNVDDLVDAITDAIFNDELKLSLPAVYEKNIGSKINYSRNNLIAQLYNYKGVSSEM